MYTYSETEKGTHPFKDSHCPCILHHSAPIERPEYTTLWNISERRWKYDYHLRCFAISVTCPHAACVNPYLYGWKTTTFVTSLLGCNQPSSYSVIQSRIPSNLGSHPVIYNFARDRWSWWTAVPKNWIAPSQQSIWCPREKIRAHSINCRRSIVFVKPFGKRNMIILPWIKRG